MFIHFYPNFDTNINLLLCVISGNTNRSHLLQSDEATLRASTTVLDAAHTLSMCIQQMGPITPSPDSRTASVINQWLDTHLPVSFLNKV